jgi:chromosome segregation protein
VNRKAPPGRSVGALEALKALQEKVKTDGKLQPWLAKHGLDGLQGLWSRMHIEPGWENALEAALRERWARWKWGAWTWCAAFWARRARCAARPAGLLQPASAPLRRTAGACRLSDLLRISDAGLRPCWWTG